MSPLLRQALTSISLFGVLAWAQLSPASPNMAAGTAAAATSATSSGPTAAVSAAVTATPSLRSTRTASSTLDPTDPRITIYNVLTVLRSAGAIPAGGRMLFSIAEGYALTNSSGENFLPLGGGQNAQDFVLGVQLGWYAAGTGSACGISFREGPDDWWSVLVTNEGHLILARQTGSTRVIDADLPIDSFSSKPYKNALWLTASGSSVAIYLNGQLETTITDTTTRGSFALNVYNAPNNPVITGCRYRNFWVWSYDDGTPTIIPSPTATRSLQ